MITSCNEVVNFNCVATYVTLVLSEQLFYTWRRALMHTIMPHVWSSTQISCLLFNISE